MSHISEQEFREQFADSLMMLIIPEATEAQRDVAVRYLTTYGPHAAIAVLGLLARRVGETMTREQIRAMRDAAINSIRIECIEGLP